MTGGRKYGWMPTDAKPRTANHQGQAPARPPLRSAARCSKNAYSANRNSHCEASATWRNARSHKVGRQANSAPDKNAPTASGAPQRAPRVHSSAPAAPCSAKQSSVYRPNHWKVAGSMPRSSLKKMLTQGRLSV